MARRFEGKARKRLGVTLMRHRTQNREAVLWRLGKADKPYALPVEVDGAAVKSARGERLPTTLELWTDRQAHVMTRLYRDGWTEQKVAEELGVTRQMVNKISKQAIAICRNVGGYCDPLWKNI